MKVYNDRQASLWLFYVYTLRRSIWNIVALVTIPALVAIALSYSLSLLYDPVTIPIAAPLDYTPVTYLSKYDYYVEVFPATVYSREFCSVVQSRLKLDCVAVDAFQYPVFDSPAFYYFGQQLKLDFGPDFNLDAFLARETEYMAFFNYTDKVKAGRRNAPLFYIVFETDGDVLKYQILVNDEIITESHRAKAMQQETDLADFDSAMYFSVIGTFLQNELEAFMVAKRLAQEPNVDGSYPVRYYIAKLPTASISKQKYWQLSYFSVFCPQAFSTVLLGLVLFKFRYFWLLKRMKISDLTFWGWMFITGLIIFYISQLFFAGFCQLCNILPYSAYDFSALSIITFLPSCAVSAFICLLIICFENYQVFTIVATIIALAFSVFPVLLSIFNSDPKSLWDDSFAPYALSYIFTFVCPIFMHYGLTELLLFTVDARDLASYNRYSGPLFDVTYLFNKAWNKHDFYRVMYAGTYHMPSVWYYFYSLLVQGAVFFSAAVYLSYCKKESKQFGLPFNFLFYKRFWLPEARENSLLNDVLNVNNLQKVYGKRQVISSFDIRLSENAICGIIGATGAGKTTILNMLAGYTDFPVQNDTKYEFMGFDMTDPYTRLRLLDQISICPQDKINMFDQLSIQENINIFKMHNSIPDCLVEEFLELLNLKSAVTKTFRQLSGGMQRRFALLVSLLQKPSILLLDEMTSNVDPLLKRNIWDAINKYFELEKCCIILTSHDSNDINNIATQVAFLDNGAIVRQGGIGEFIQQIPGMKLVLNNNKNTALQLLYQNKWKHFVNWDQKQCEVFVEVKNNLHLDQLVTLLESYLSDSDYSLVSYPINEVLYKSYQLNVAQRDESTLPTTEQTIELANEHLKLIDEHYQTRKSHYREAASYMNSALLSKWFEALQSKFFVLLLSLGTALFFVVLEKLILDNVQTNPDAISDQYYTAVHNYSLTVFKQACTQGTGSLDEQVFDCITTRRSALFKQSTAYTGPYVKYAVSPQRYLDIMGFDSMEDYHFVFGHNSLQMSDYGDNLHAYIIGANSYNASQQVFSIEASDYAVLQDSYEFKLNDAYAYAIYNTSSGLQRYFDRRFVNTSAGLVSRANIVVNNSVQKLFNDYIRHQNQNVVNKSLSDLSEDERLSYELKSHAAIIDPGTATIYLQLPYYRVGKFYENVKTVFNDSAIDAPCYFRHSSPVFGGPWLIDIDPVYPVNYANDFITKTYTAELRRRLAGNKTISELYNDVYIQGEFKSYPKFYKNAVRQPKYAAHNSNAFFSFMYFIPWIQCLFSVIALQHIHAYVDQFTLAFVNGVSVSIFKYILSKVLLEMAVYSVKVYALYLMIWIFRPADSFFMPEIWAYPLLYSISIVCFLFFLELLLSNYSVSCLYLGAVTIIVVLVNPIMRPSLFLALVGSLFIPGFFYVVAARMNALYESFNKWWLVLGVLVQFTELFVLVLAKYLRTIRNAMSIKREAECDFILKADNVNAYYNKATPILADFNLSIPHGATICLAGANGCGKSTFTKCLTGYQVHCDGHIVVNERIGIVPQDDCFDRNLTVIQNLRKFACFSEVSANTLCEKVGLGQFRNERARQLSAGYARILTIALVLATNPRLLILDEVTVGLDFAMKKLVWRAILAQDCSVLIITHDMLEIEALCDYVCIMQNGKILSQESLQSTLLQANIGYILTVFNSPVNNTGNKEFTIKHFSQNSGIRDVTNWITSHDIEYERWNIEKISMESVFLHIIGRK